MRRTPLDPPRPVLSEALASDEPRSRWSDVTTPAVPEIHVDAPARDVLSGVAPAEERLRALFHPRRGWFRRLERRTSHWLAHAVYPWIPGLHLPYGRQLRRRLTLSEAEIELDGLPTSFDGLRILFLSDLHAGPFVSPRVLQAAVERLLGVEPDVVLLGGDLTTACVDEFETHRAAFESMRAPLGVYCVLGNHDHYSREPQRLRELIEDAGITVLHNRAVELERGGQSLDLAGVDDLLMGRPDLEAALDGARAPVVLLSHNPDLFFRAARRGVALTLAGHTHGGQIRIPGLPVLVRQSRYRLDHGRYRSGGSELVVSRGLGAVGLPLRLACRPEGVLIRIRRSPA